MKIQITMRKSNKVLDKFASCMEGSECTISIPFVISFESNEPQNWTTETRKKEWQDKMNTIHDGFYYEVESISAII